MAYRHGVYTSELPTSIVPAVNTTAGLPVIFGTAPLHLAESPADANRPMLCYSYDEAAKAFGYSKDWGKYTLCEAVYSQFALYGYGPVVLVNVLDPSKHKESKENQSITLTGGKAVITEPVMLSTLKVRALEAGEPLKQDVDYTAEYDDDEELVITALEGGALAEKNSAFVSYDALKPDQVTKDDIIGGIDTSTGKSKGLETIDQVFPLFGLVPGIILAPGWSHIPEVAAIMKAKASNINEHFNAMVIADVPADEVTKYTDVSAWKNKNGYTGENEIVCWPMVKMGDKVYHMSTHVLGVIASVDAANEDIPYESPSNKSMSINGLCLKDGSEVIMGPEQANYLNGQGIVTALNFIGGWKCWGNRTGCYPSNTDAKDAFISIKRMFYWHAQTFIQTYWVKVDKPITKRLIQTVIDSENIRLNGLVAQGMLLGARVEFLESENPTTNLLDGKIKFHTYFTPPAPAREIDNVIEYDTSYFSSLFG